MKTSSESLADQIRTAVLRSGISGARLSSETGISQSTVCRFLNGHQSISVDLAGKITKHLGLELRKAE